MYRNIEGTNFIWHGEWADPEVEYNGHTYSYWALEDTLYDRYKEDCAENNRTVDDDEFEKWCEQQDLVSFMQDIETFTCFEN